MTAAIEATPKSSIDYINPVISATQNVFDTMLGVTPKRSGLKLKVDSIPDHDVSAVIGLTGQVQGTIVLSFAKQVALSVLEKMLGSEATEIDDEVCDAIGELANMVAGGAKAQLARLDLSLSIPNVVTGPDHVVHFKSDIKPICISFDSEIGPFTIEVGFTTPTT